jgi:hypothetical protein
MVLFAHPVRKMVSPQQHSKFVYEKVAPVGTSVKKPPIPRIA